MSKILLTKLNEDLKLAGYAKRSRQSYVRAVRQLRNFWGCDLEEIEEQQVREYWLHCKDELDWMPATMRISYSGIKFFYEHTLKQDWETLKLLKIKQQVTPPTVLSIDEVRKLLANMPTQMNKIRISLLESNNMSYLYTIFLFTSRTLFLSVPSADLRVVATVALVQLPFSSIS